MVLTSAIPCIPRSLRPETRLFSPYQDLFSVLCSLTHICNDVVSGRYFCCGCLASSISMCVVFTVYAKIFEEVTCLSSLTHSVMAPSSREELRDQLSYCIHHQFARL